MTVSQLTVRQTMREGIVGQLYDANPRLLHEDAFSFGGDRSAESTVVDLAGAAANSTEYAFYIGEERISYTSDATATEAEIHAGLAAAFNANPVARGLATATPAAATTTIVANYKGIDLGIAPDGVRLTAVTTAADAGDLLPFGRAVAYNGEDNVLLPGGATTAAQIAGISIMTYDEMSDIVGNAGAVGYRQGTSARILLTGRIFVEGVQAAAATRTSAVWIGTDTAEAGKFFTADNVGTTRIQITDGSLAWYKGSVITIKRGL